MTGDWIVWSEEHGGWWGPGKWGYVRSIKDAGRYSEDEALEIERKANRYLKDANAFNEIAMPDPLAARKPAR